MTSLTCALNASERLQMKYANADPMRDHCVCMLYYNKLSILLFLLYLSVKSPQDNVKIFNVSFGVLEAKLQLQVGLYYYRTLCTLYSLKKTQKMVCSEGLPRESFLSLTRTWYGIDLHSCRVQLTKPKNKHNLQIPHTSC